MEGVTGELDPSLRIQRSVVDKREGLPLKQPAASAIVRDSLNGEVTDDQLSAWLATLAAVGMARDEVVALTAAYLNDIPPLDLSMLPGPVVDKHSTGGVGDKTSLIVSPIVAACGLTVVKMSGRGLGFAGGTIDKLESIPGMRVDLSSDEMLRVAAATGMVISGQTEGLAPGDAITYRLRDTTGTVESIPLIAASIMSKKIAVGADGLLLDVKTGEGALVPQVAQARHLAELMVGIGTEMGMRTRAVLTDMSQPLGRAVGNLLEVDEAVSVLAGEDVPSLTPTCIDLAAEMLCVADPSRDKASALDLARDALRSGRAFSTFVSWVEAQGGDASILDDAGSRQRTLRRTVFSEADGWVTAVSARAVGTAALHVGAGRRRSGDRIEHSAGVVIHRHVGDRVAKGEPLADLVTEDQHAEVAFAKLSSAFLIDSFSLPAPLSSPETVIC
jgi:pyrimidine-nucleoside phosphorylase